MKCNKLHSALAIKDQEIKERKENTVAAFNLVKDWALDKVIQESIDKEFKSSVSLYEETVYDYLFDKLNIDVSKLYYDTSWGLLFEKNPPLYTSPLRHYPMSTEDRTIILDEEINQMEQLERYTKKFDHKLFWNLLDDHILRNGFKTRKMKNLWNQTVTCEYEYVTTRTALERACCPSSERKECSNQLSGQDMFAVVILAVIVLIIIIFWIGGAMQ